MKKNLKLIIFDLDGTLVDAYKAVSRSLNYAFKKIGLPPVDDDIIKRSVGWGDRNLIQRFVPLSLTAKALSIYRRHHKKALKKGTKFLPGAKKILFGLKKRKYKLAIASNRPTLFTKIILKHLQADHLFDIILCADKVKHPKPAGDILSAILKKFKILPGETLYVGDMTIDVETAKNAGVKSVIVLTGSSQREEIVPLKPFKIIDRLADLSSFLEKIYVC